MEREFILKAFTDDGIEYCIKTNMQEVVRCKDCVSWGTRCKSVTLPVGNADVLNGDCLRFGQMMEPDFFCAWAERKEE